MRSGWALHLPFHVPKKRLNIGPPRPQKASVPRQNIQFIRPGKKNRASNPFRVPTDYSHPVRTQTPKCHLNNELAEFKVEVDKLALALMTNPKAEKQARAAATSPPKASRTAPGSPESCPAADGAPHTLVPLRSILGDDWKKGKQMRCMMCNKDTVWVCGCCSTGADGLVPICPEYSIPRKGPNRGNKVMHPCLHKHRAAPLFFPKGRCQGGGSCKRQRSPAADDLSVSDEDAP